ncbi:DUF6314 family protein [Arthrobacter rhizosphaerae]|uniref:DUF6314 family protein n=1 Tax=Arthrobacter rhizosphaerae TaxID=2855490 RepID=UPI001FF57FDB|nr:DUF6314 family protein [Arthrobacter rhizosphaerae]
MNSHTPGAASAVDLRAYLLGFWSVDRILWDRSADIRGTFGGVATFLEMDDGALRFREEGTVRWVVPGGEPFTGPAQREYVLRPSESPDTLEVFFPDGRPFHRMSFLPADDSELHWCNPDTYRVTYSLIGPDEYRYAWDVSGPAKNLLLESVLHRGAVPRIGGGR